MPKIVGSLAQPEEDVLPDWYEVNLTLLCPYCETTVEEYYRHEQDYGLCRSQPLSETEARTSLRETLDKLYAGHFRLNEFFYATKCPHCHREIANTPILIESLV